MRLSWPFLPIFFSIGSVNFLSLQGCKRNRAYSAPSSPTVVSLCYPGNNNNKRRISMDRKHLKQTVAFFIFFAGASAVIAQCNQTQLSKARQDLDSIKTAYGRNCGAFERCVSSARTFISLLNNTFTTLQSSECIKPGPTSPPSNDLAVTLTALLPHRQCFLPQNAVTNSNNLNDLRQRLDEFKHGRKCQDFQNCWDWSQQIGDLNAQIAQLDPPCQNQNNSSSAGNPGPTNFDESGDGWR